MRARTTGACVKSAESPADKDRGDVVVVPRRKEHAFRMTQDPWRRRE